jgi:two-component system CheB/CheR fusion protein
MNQATQHAPTTMLAQLADGSTASPWIATQRTPAIRVPLRLAALRPDPRADEIAGISHELRNSLSVIRNAARLLRLPASTDLIDQSRKLIERHAEQMARHIDDLLGVSSVPNGKQAALQRSHLDLRTIIGHSVGAIAPDMERRGHDLVVELPVDAIWVHADAGRLEQVFSNILINAAKYTPNGGKIVLTLDREDTHARIRISDTGIGIDAAMLLRVFDRYAQADADAACSEGGSGIGLALVRELVEKHGGTVRAASQGLGCGSEFTVVLPVLWDNAAKVSPIALWG